MKNKIDKLYLAKIRSCIMDIVMTFVSEGKVIEPRPDYFEYYTIILKKNKEQFIDIFNPKNELKIDINSEKLEYYQEDLIIELEPLENYLDIKNKISNKELDLIFNVITKTKKLEKKYGYKNIK